MSKFLKFSFLFLAIFNIFILTPSKVSAADSCSSKNIKIEFDDLSGNNKTQSSIQVRNNQSFGVSVKIPTDNVEKKWKYVAGITTQGAVGIRNFTPFFLKGIPGGEPSGIEGTYNVYHWNVGGVGGVTNQTFKVLLKHNEGPEIIEVLRTLAPDVCESSQDIITITNPSLINAANCAITMSDNFESGTPITGTVNLKNVPDIRYAYKLYDENISIPPSFLSPTSPKDPAELPGAREIILGDIRAGVSPFIEDQLSMANYWSILSERSGGVPLPPQRKDNNNSQHFYTAVVFAFTKEILQTPIFACGMKKVTVTNAKTSTPTTTTLPSGSSGNGGINSIGVEGKKSTASGISCDTPANPGIATAIGCIHTDPTLLIGDFFKLAIGIGGGLALLMMIFGAFGMITSAGNPESLKSGQQVFTNAIIGLLFIIFSVLLLRIIGVDILGFGTFLGTTTTVTP